MPNATISSNCVGRARLNFLSQCSLSIVCHVIHHQTRGKWKYGVIKEYIFHSFFPYLKILPLNCIVLCVLDPFTDTLRFSQNGRILVFIHSLTTVARVLPTKRMSFLFLVFSCNINIVYIYQVCLYQIVDFSSKLQ